jgi:hypothetical protein
MKAPLPPDFTPPFWATKNFRLLLIVGIMGLSVMAVMVFQIGPALNQKPVSQKKADPNAFVPKPAVPGEVREIKYEGVLEKVKDGTSIDDQEQPYQYVVRALSRMDAALLAKDAKSVDYQYFSKMPVEMRGETVKITGLFLQSNPIRVDAAPGGVNFIHRTYLVSDVSGGEGFVVDLLEPPGELPYRQVVTLDAVFFKLGSYEGKKGPVQAPLFLGKGLRTLTERAGGSPVTNLSGGVILGVAIGMMLLMLFLTSRMFKKSSKPPAPRTPAVSIETLKT